MPTANLTSQPRIPREQRKSILRQWKKDRYENALNMAKLGEAKGHKFCVLYIKRDIREHQREFRTPWFSSRDRAHAACRLMKQRYGERTRPRSEFLPLTGSRRLPISQVARLNAGPESFTDGRAGEYGAPCQHHPEDR